VLWPPVMAAASSHACAAHAARSSLAVETARVARPPPDGLPAISYERTPGAASRPAPRPYRRREPEKTALYALVREHLETLLDEARRGNDSGDGYPAFIEREFRHYLHCGLLSRGFARLRCPSCGFERLVAFSCKGRICPSCWARRAADTAAHLVDRVLPVAPYRQWVLTFPFEVRFLLAVDGAFLTEMLSAFMRSLFAWMRLRARRIGISKGEPGSVTFIQRFGGALNLNPHRHSLVSDGVFVQGPDGRATFVPLPPPDDEDVRALAQRLAKRLGAIARRRFALVRAAKMGSRPRRPARLRRRGTAPPSPPRRPWRPRRKAPVRPRGRLLAPRRTHRRSTRPRLPRTPLQVRPQATSVARQAVPRPRWSRPSSPAPALAHPGRPLRHRPRPRRVPQAHRRTHPGSVRQPRPLPRRLRKQVQAQAAPPASSIEALRHAAVEPCLLATRLRAGPRRRAPTQAQAPRLGRSPPPGARHRCPHLPEVQRPHGRARVLERPARRPKDPHPPAPARRHTAPRPGA